MVWGCPNMCTVVGARGYIWRLCVSPISSPKRTTPTANRIPPPCLLHAIVSVAPKRPHALSPEVVYDTVAGAEHGQHHTEQEKLPVGIQGAGFILYEGVYICPSIRPCIHLCMHACLSVHLTVSIVIFFLTAGQWAGLGREEGGLCCVCICVYVCGCMLVRFVDIRSIGVVFFTTIL